MEQKWQFCAINGFVKLTLISFISENMVAYLPPHMKYAWSLTLLKILICKIGSIGGIINNQHTYAKR